MSIIISIVYKLKFKHNNNKEYHTYNYIIVTLLLMADAE